MTDDLIIAVVVGTLGVAAVLNGGLDGFVNIAGAFVVALVVRWIVLTSRSAGRARRHDSGED
jgi:hypothetical protein